MSKKAFRSSIHELIDTSWSFTFLDKDDAISHLYDVLCSPSALKALFFRGGEYERLEQYSVMDFTDSEDFYQEAVSDSLWCVTVLAGDDGKGGGRLAVIWFPIEGLWQNLIVHLYGRLEHIGDAADVIRSFSDDAIDYYKPK